MQKRHKGYIVGSIRRLYSALQIPTLLWPYMNLHFLSAIVVLFILTLKRNIMIGIMGDGTFPDHGKMIGSSLGIKKYDNKKDINITNLRKDQLTYSL